ncbi:hypothetical protein G9A89_007629 [Geosiphon pyriformis]|nr:hypothetical protein G9A89_007629 [Geosiphon pyriformis]
MATVGSVIAVMKKTIKVSGSEGGFKAVASKKKRKGGVLEEDIDNKGVAAKALGARLWDSEAGDTTESESIDMEKKCLVEETSVNYDDNGTFTGRDSDQTLKGLYMKTKKVLGKPLGVIDYDTVNVEDDVLDDSLLLPSPLPVKLSIQVPVCKFFALDIDLVALANDHGVVINTNLKCPINNRMNQTIVLKKIPVGTSIEAVHAAISEFGFIKLIKMQLVGLWQKAIVELENQNQADLLAAEWSIFIGKDAVCVTWADVDKQMWNARDEFKTLFYTLPMGTNAHNLWDFIGLDQFRLAKIYEKKSAPVTRPLAFGRKTWASMVGSIHSSVSLEYDSQLGSIGNGKPLSPVVNNLEKRLVNIESSFVSLVKQIGELAKRLESFILAVSQPSPGCQLLVTPPSQNQGENIVMGVGLGDATSNKTAAVSGSTASPEVVKLENMLEDLFASVMSLSACLDDLALTGGAPSLPLFQ